MKIAIITFHFESNYGALLQAYALSEKLRVCGHNVCFIDYIPKKKKCFKDKAKAFITNLIIWKDILEKIRRIRSFKKCHFRLVKLNDTQKMASFDAYICGSDQIWNLDLFEDMTPYFLKFKTNNKGIKMSYAASIGKDVLNPSDKIKYSSLLKDIDHISVREESAVSLIEEISDKKPVQVIDPVFLCDKEHWLSLLQQDRIIKYPYILLYQMEKSDTLLENSIRLANEKKLPIIHIYGGFRKRDGIHKVINNVGPLEFLNLLNHASYVCTNSFHGTAFSLIFNKSFFVIPHSTRNTRIDSLLSKVGLEDHILRCPEHYICLSKKDFKPNSLFQSLMEKHIKESLDFLKRVF